MLRDFCIERGISKRGRYIGWELSENIRGYQISDSNFNCDMIILIGKRYFLPPEEDIF